MSISTIQKRIGIQSFDTKEMAVKKETAVKEETMPKKETEAKKEAIAKKETPENMDMLQRMQEKQKELGTGQKQSGTADYKPSEDLLKLMEAKTVGEVRSLMGKIKANMGRVKASGADSEEIKAAVAKMKKVLKKAQNKEKALLKEEKMELQKKMAENREEFQEAKEISDTLKGKKASRRLKEMTDVLGADNMLEQSSQTEAQVLGMTGEIGGGVDMYM